MASVWPLPQSGPCHLVILLSVLRRQVASFCCPSTQTSSLYPTVCWPRPLAHFVDSQNFARSPDPKSPLSLLCKGLLRPPPYRGSHLQAVTAGWHSITLALLFISSALSCNLRIIDHVLFSLEYFTPRTTSGTILKAHSHVCVCMYVHVSFLNCLGSNSGPWARHASTLPLRYTLSSKIIYF